MGSHPLDLKTLEAFVARGRVLQDPDLLTSYEIPRRGKPGVARFVVEPGDVSEVQKVASWAYQHRIRLVVQGANTGLVGASTPDQSGSQGVLGLSRLQDVLDLSVVDRIVVVESGVRLDELNELLAEEGLFFPIELGANPSIGGLVAANAGGARTIRYGDTGSRVVGIEGVLADEEGSTVGGLSVLSKDNSRLRVGRLFVGSFGALGAITRVALKVASRPTAVATAMIAARSHQDALTCLTHMEKAFGESLSAFEFISRPSMDLALENVPGLRPPFPQMDGGCYVLVEVGTQGASAGLEEALAEVLGELSSGKPSSIEDAVLAPPAHLWSLRHSLSEGVSRAGAFISFDLSVPRQFLPSLGDRIDTVFSEEGDRPLVSEYGHWGDGGTHLQLVYQNGELPIDESSVREKVYDIVVNDLGGSFSAEHGIGPHNAEFYRKYVPAHEQEFERRIKQMFDPRGIWGTAPFSTE